MARVTFPNLKCICSCPLVSGKKNQAKRRTINLNGSSTSWGWWYDSNLGIRNLKSAFECVATETDSESQKWKSSIFKLKCNVVSIYCQICYASSLFSEIVFSLGRRHVAFLLFGQKMGRKNAIICFVQWHSNRKKCNCGKATSCRPTVHFRHSKQIDSSSPLLKLRGQ